MMITFGILLVATLSLVPEASATAVDTRTVIREIRHSVSADQFKTLTSVFGVQVGRTTTTELLEKMGPAEPVVTNQFHRYWKKEQGLKRAVTYCYHDSDQSLFVVFEKNPNETVFSAATLSKKVDPSILSKCKARNLSRSKFPFGIWFGDSKYVLEKRLERPAGTIAPGFMTWGFESGRTTAILQAFFPKDVVNELRVITVEMEPKKRDHSKASRHSLIDSK